MRFRQLLPEPSDAELDDLLAALDLREHAPADRPYVMVNFVSSADGRATFGGRSGALGDEGDKAMFHGLREQADAVLTGTGTLRVERYGRMLGKEDRRQRRVERGLTPEPLACIVTRSGSLPSDLPLLSEPEARVVVFSAMELDLGPVAAQLTCVRLAAEEMTLQTVLQRLRREHDVQLLLCEGGPTLFSSLLHERLVDEFFLTIAPKLAGGGAGPGVTSGPELPEPLELGLHWLLEREGSLFLRYGLHGSTR